MKWDKWNHKFSKTGGEVWKAMNQPSKSAHQRKRQTKGHKTTNRRGWRRGKWMKLLNQQVVSFSSSLLLLRFRVICLFSASSLEELAFSLSSQLGSVECFWRPSNPRLRNLSPPPSSSQCLTTIAVFFRSQFGCARRELSLFCPHDGEVTLWCSFIFSFLLCLGKDYFFYFENRVRMILAAIYCGRCGFAIQLRFLLYLLTFFLRREAVSVAASLAERRSVRF